jgi:hypothetical protein
MYRPIYRHILDKELCCEHFQVSRKITCCIDIWALDFFRLLTSVSFPCLQVREKLELTASRFHQPGRTYWSMFHISDTLVYLTSIFNCVGYVAWTDCGWLWMVSWRGYVSKPVLLRWYSSSCLEALWQTVQKRSIRLVLEWDFRFSRRREWRWLSSGLQCHVVW